jgi:hypothetical protein
MYAGEYWFDFLMVRAQGCQESHLDQSMRSEPSASRRRILASRRSRESSAGSSPKKIGEPVK